MLNLAGFRLLNGQGHGTISTSQSWPFGFSSVSVSHSELCRAYARALKDSTRPGITGGTGSEYFATRGPESPDEVVWMGPGASWRELAIGSQPLPS